MHVLSHYLWEVTSVWTAVSWVKVLRLTPSLVAMITAAIIGGHRLEKHSVTS